MAAISNLQESLTINFGIAANGLFPSGSGGAGTSLTIGTIRMYGFDFLPGGHADANGGNISIAQNTALFSLMGTTFGGDGRTDFGMPDLQNNLAVGQGTGPGLTNRVIGSEFGSDTIDIQSVNLPAAVAGRGLPVSNTETSTSLVWAINAGGFFPSRGGSGTEHGFLAQVQPFAVSNTAFGLPAGWTPAEGQVLPINGNEALFSLIGTIYGGDGRTTFSLPDLRGRVPIGAGDEVTLGQTVGVEEIILSEANLPTVFGGTGAEIDNRQPSLGLNFLVAQTGLFPSRTGSQADPDQAFIGEITLFAGNFAPNGWALAQGQTLPVAQNQSLFSLLGTEFGGDGRTTFNLPDFRNRTPVDETATREIGTVEGENFTVLQAADLADLEEAGSLIVTTLDDVVNALDGETSLREAVTLANDTAGADTITFDASLAGGTLRLTQGELTISEDVTIDGDTDADGDPNITLSGDATGDGVGVGNDSRVFTVATGRLTLESIKLDGGNTSDGNGGLVDVAAAGALTAVNAEFSNGFAAFYGGGIHNGGGAIYLTNVTVANNQAYAGGGIATTTSTGDAVLRNVTIAENTASYGGGLSSFDFVLNDIPDVTLLNSTVTGNIASFFGGGLQTFPGGTLTLANSIVTGNAAPGSADIYGQFGSLFTPREATSRNIVAGRIYEGTTSQGTVATEEIFANTSTFAGSQQIGALNDQTDGIRTAPLLARLDNRAIDSGLQLVAGSEPQFDILDARGELRPINFAAIVDATGGNGSDLGAFEVQGLATDEEDIFFLDATNNDVDGLDGDDLFVIGQADITVDGGLGQDVLDYARNDTPSATIGAFEVGVIINLGVETEQATGYGQQTLAGAEGVIGTDFGDLVNGNDEDNFIDGRDGADGLFGGAGNDLIQGGAGFDVVVGGAGNDTLFGGDSEGDLLAYFDAPGNLTVEFIDSFSGIASSSSTFIQDDVIGDDFEGFAGATDFSNIINMGALDQLTAALGGAQDDTIFGGSGTDQILGLAGNDVLYGNDGGDALIGQAGDDLLFGGAGADFFFFDFDDGNDSIREFEAADQLFFTNPAGLSFRPIPVLELIDADNDGQQNDVHVRFEEALSVPLRNGTTITVFDADVEAVDAAIVFGF